MRDNITIKAGSGSPDEGIDVSMGDTPPQNNPEFNQIPITLGRMAQQVEVRNPDEDWTGITDPVERRKLQNRLNQRTYYRRKIQRLKGEKAVEAGVRKRATNSNNARPAEAQSPTTVSRRGGKDVTAVKEVSNVVLGGMRPGRSLLKSLVHHYGTNSAQLLKVMKEFETSMQPLSLGSPRADLLLTLVQFNVFRALLCNTSVMSFPMSWTDCEAVSIFCKDPQYLPISCPPALQPTQLQRKVEHHPWIDLFPIPTMRDNILRKGEEWDDTQLCIDLVECCSEMDDRKGFIVWGDDPADSSSWEVSEQFLEKWGWVVQGCYELFESTNHWRMQRGERPLFTVASSVKHG